MAKQKHRSTRQTRSIAKRLNGALIRRRFLAVLIADVVVALSFIVLWCGITESFYCGELALIRKRDFTNVAASVADNITSYFKGDFRVSIEEVLEPVDDVEDTHIREVKLRDERRLPFSGVYYVFNVDSDSIFRLGNYGEVIPDAETKITVRYGATTFTYTSPDQVAVDSSMMLTTVLIATLGIIALQCIYYTLSQFTGRLLIKKYLRPIDDLALAAERLSSTIQSSNNDSVRMRLDDVEFDEISQAIHAIDAIDDSHSRLDIPETELGGLEAAINNMLRRLDEEKLKQIRFVDDASHELRTPIAVIQGYVNMLDRWGKNDSQIMDEAISALMTESEHMKTLIDQLLFLARGEMDRHAMNMVPLDAAELMEEVYEESVMIDPDHKYSAETRSVASEHRPMIIADAAMIKQAVRILRDNAAKYTPAGGSISLKVYDKKLASSQKDSPTYAICMEVADSGVGISAEELPRIFDRFYRGENARTSSASGSGLGLSIAKWIVEAHGGTIEAASVIGVGTKMTIVLRRI